VVVVQWWLEDGLTLSSCHTPTLVTITGSKDNTFRLYNLNSFIYIYRGRLQWEYLAHMRNENNQYQPYDINQQLRFLNYHVSTHYQIIFNYFWHRSFLALYSSRLLLYVKVFLQHFIQLHLLLLNIIITHNFMKKKTIKTYLLI
jgi:hypothetical protein